jgi:acyl-CoA hydrolase
MNPKTAESSQVTLTLLMGPSEANLLGNVHGGVIMKLCDEAGAMAAVKFARCQVVTVAVDSMSFHSPVHLGNLLTISAEVSWTGRTSLETRVVVTAEHVISGAVTHTNTAYIVYVALGEDGRPTAIPQLLRETEEEKARFARATARQQHRLKLRQQEKSVL